MGSSSAREIASFFRCAAANLGREAERAEGENAKDALATCIRYSSGSVSRAEQRRMYNPHGPYSVAGPHPPQDPAIVNLQSGAFRAGWRARGPERQGDGSFVTVIDNASREAAFLEHGTKAMISRPLIAAVEAEIGPRVEARREAALTAAMAGGG